MDTPPGRFSHSRQQGQRVLLRPLETENVPKRRLQFAPCAKLWIEVEIKALLEFVLFYAISPDTWPSFSHSIRFWPEAANFLKKTAGRITQSGIFCTFVYTCVYSAGACRLKTKLLSSCFKTPVHAERHYLGCEEGEDAEMEMSEQATSDASTWYVFVKNSTMQMHNWRVSENL